MQQHEHRPDRPDRPGGPAGPEGGEPAAPAATPGTRLDDDRRPVSVPAAARALGISERAVRKRIATGALVATPAGRSYTVWLPLNVPDVALVASGTTGPAGPVRPEGPEGPVLGSAGRGAELEPGLDASYRVEPAGLSLAARQQLAAIRDEWLAPLVDRLAQTERELGRVTAERDARDGVIGELRDRLQRAEREQAAAASTQRPQGSAGATKGVSAGNDAPGLIGAGNAPDLRGTEPAHVAAPTPGRWKRWLTRITGGWGVP